MLEFRAGRGPRLMLDETSVLDVGSCLVDGVDLAPGTAVPDDGDPRISHSVQGFMFTCGPDHIRHPEPIDGHAERMYPLHGSFSASPADVTLFECGELEARAEARITVHLADGGTALLMRRWRIDAETGEVFLEDLLTNAGSSVFAPMLMYHMNLGARLFDDAVALSGDMFNPQSIKWTFGDEDGHVFCVPAGQGDAEVRLGPIAPIGGKTLAVSFNTATLPYLQMWRNQLFPANVLGIEPASHDWRSRATLGQEGALQTLQPGESRSYGLRFRFIDA